VIVHLSEAEYAALRAQVAAMAALLDALAPEPAPGGCRHVNIVDKSTLAERHLVCRDCGERLE